MKTSIRDEIRVTKVRACLVDSIYKATLSYSEAISILAVVSLKKRIIFGETGLKL